MPLASVLIAALTALVVTLTWQVDSGTGISWIDPRALDWLTAHRGEPLTGVFRVVTDLGDTLSMAILAALTISWFLLRRATAVAVLVGVAALGAGVLVVSIKHLVGRHRPPEVSRLVVEQSLSYPSGHTVSTTVVVGIVAITVIPHLHSRWIRVTATAFAVTFAIAVGLSRVYLGAHWFTDVLAGWTVSLLWLTICVMAYTAVRRHRHEAAAAAEGSGGSEDLSAPSDHRETTAPRVRR